MHKILRRTTSVIVHLFVFGLLTRNASSVAAATCTPASNPVATENNQDGSPQSEWDLSNSCVEPDNHDCQNGPAYIQGFAKEISVNRGQQVEFKVRIIGVSYPVSFKLDIYRMGYYRGSGARKVATINSQQTAAQPACTYATASGLVDCGVWSINASWDGKESGTIVPSGIYFAKLSSSSVTGASHIVFVIRNDEGCADILFQTADTSWQAYNIFSDGRGKMDLYFRDTGWVAPTSAPTERPRAFKVSYNRPFYTRGGADDEGGPHSWIFNAEYPMVRWLEANGYNVSYSTGVDTDRAGAKLSEHKAFLIIGHDEYWSGTQRANVVAARNAGIHIAAFAGNEVFWKTRWEDNYHTLVSYKETHSAAHIDPEPVWTGTFRDARFSPPLDGGLPENELLGNIFTSNNLNIERAVTVSQADGLLRFWRSTPAATLATGSSLSLAARTLGFEYDTDIDNGFRRPGTIVLSSTPGVAAGARVIDEGVSYQQSSTDTHHMTLFRQAGGALVFSAGTIQWSWGLDCHHDRGDACALYNSSSTEQQNFQTMRQATVNIFADMGVQPATIQAGLSIQTASTDTTAPVSTITAPASAATIIGGASTTVNGTASDTGGIVGAVEISVDGGAHWHPTVGRAAWSYAWTPNQAGSITIKTRAVDDSGNLETPSSGRTVQVVGTPYSGTASAVPGIIQAEDFDNGGEGVAYHDTTSGNSGGAYRTTDVDITQCPSSCGQFVGYVKAGEWLTYSINVATTGTYDFAVYGSAGVASGLFHIEVDGANKTGAMSIAQTGDNWIVGATYKAGVSLTAGSHVMKVVVDQEPGWLGNFDSFRITRAYNATALAIPGTVEAEDFNEGGEGIAYHDTTAGNSAGAYRTTDVDIAQCPTGTSCGRLVAYVKAGEWLEYSVNVGTSGIYDFAVSGTNGFAGGLFHIEIDGVDKTGPMSIAQTGDNWIVGVTYKAGVSLTAGPHVLRVVVDQEPGWLGNFDSFRISRAYNATASAVPGSFEVEDFNEGGEGVSYHDTTSGNSGTSAYRTSDVDISQCPTSPTCGRLIGYVKSGEWLEYSINVATSGIYDFAVYGSGFYTDGAFHIEIDGTNKTGSMASVATGDNWIVAATTRTGVALTAGPHVLRISMDQNSTNGWVNNFDRVTISGPN
jgi:hypothetical protein